MFYVYIFISLRDRKLYIGFTNNLKNERIKIKTTRWYNLDI